MRCRSLSAPFLPAVFALLAACSQSEEPQLMNVRAASTGPDEFAIQPNKPLIAPEDYASLPEPTPGGGNLADPTPFSDAYAALGGRAGATVAGDAALLTYTTRFGRSASIRTQLARADLAFRRTNRGRPLERLFDTNVYFQAYERFALDQHRELERLRAAGIPTPTAPPPR